MIKHEDNKHNCQLCTHEFLGRCGIGIRNDVSMENEPCDNYHFGGTDERLKEIEGDSVFRHCTFTSVWDGGDEVTTNAVVNLYTKEVIPEKVDPDEIGYECEILEKEFVTMDDGTIHTVSPKNEMTENTEFWYQ